MVEPGGWMDTGEVGAMGGCGRTRQTAWPAREEALAPPPRPEDLVGDADRRRAADLAGRAFAEGLLEVEELEPILERILRARTRADLEAATSALPAGWLAAARRSEAAAQRAAAERSAHRGEVRAYLAVMALLVGIWCLAALSSGATYFWPIWPALGWGLPLLLRSKPPGGERRPGPEPRPRAPSP